MLLNKLYSHSPLFVVCLLAGCTSNLSPVFVQSLHEHKRNTQTVNNSLIETFKEEQSKETRSEAIKAYQEIMDNLNSITNEAEVLDKYMLNNLSEKELIALYKKQLKGDN